MYKDIAAICAKYEAEEQRDSLRLLDYARRLASPEAGVCEGFEAISVLADEIEKLMERIGHLERRLDKCDE